MARKGPSHYILVNGLESSAEESLWLLKHHLISSYECVMEDGRNTRWITWDNGGTFTSESHKGACSCFVVQEEDNKDQ